MNPIEFLADEFVDFSTDRTTVRELVELVVGAVIFVLAAAGLARALLGERAALVVGGVLAVVFGITVVSQAYWAVVGREDYDE